MIKTGDKVLAFDFGRWLEGIFHSVNDEGKYLVTHIGLEGPTEWEYDPIWVKKED